jgi:UDPglucose 6-dehydrogenase
MSKIKITVIGAGYVGMSLAVLLSKDNNVSVLDIDESKVKLINAGNSTIEDPEITKVLENKTLNISATTDPSEALADSNYIFIATPTNFNESLNLFETSSVENAIKNSLKFSMSNSLIIVKSTVPIGFTNSQSAKNNTDRIIFSPEFLREGMALYDNLHPSRLIIGGNKNELNSTFAKMMLHAAVDKEFDIFFMDADEAEAVKLFSNTYLAMRVSFFNELDSFAMEKKLSTLNILKGVSSDPRIGNYYNNPSFGYGGYCLPKDTKQLLANYDGILQNLITATIESNSTRKAFLVSKIKAINPGTIGIYRLKMKEGSENFRESAILSLVSQLSKSKFKIIIFEPTVKEKFYQKFPVKSNLNDFIKSSDMIIANRLHNDLQGCEHKVFTRDLFHQDI